jgi:hypothetical protein
VRDERVGRGRRSKADRINLKMGEAQCGVGEHKKGFTCRDK